VQEEEKEDDEGSAKMTTRTIMGSLLCALLLVSVAAAPAQADRTLITQKTLVPVTDPQKPAPLPDGQVEGACGLALGLGNLYVSDYYHGAVDVFNASNGAATQARFLAGSPPEGPCGLARSAAGALYANLWHQSVVRLTPSPLVFDEDESTGVAVDAVGNVYVNDRTYVAVYEPSGDPVEVGVEPEPLLIGVGSLEDAYGLAVFEGRVYVPDASTNTIEVFEPAIDPDTPVTSISHSFKSLVDAAVAVDPSTGNLLVADNTQPGFTHPKAAIYEFNAAGVFLDKLPGSPVHGEPTGLTVAADGTLYVTDGNTEMSNVFKYSPYSASFGGGAIAPPLSSGSSVSSELGAPPAAAAQSAPPAAAGIPTQKARKSRGPTELVQKGPIRVAVSGSLAPKRLPRVGTAPITVTIGGHISSTEPQTPPQLRKVSFAFNRAGRLDTRGLPRCLLSDIDPSSTRQALEACRPSLVGEGLFSANVLLPEQSPFPSAGKVMAFNGIQKGKPVVFAHIYGTKPVPTSIVLPLAIRRGKGTFGTRLDASFADLTGDWGYVEGIDLRLGRKYSFQGRRHSFLSAGCPAPKGFPGALFALARTTFSFVGGRNLSATLTRSCKVR
jgi:hypothetical protein